METNASPNDHASPSLFLGFDLSTQQLKVVALEQRQQEKDADNCSLNMHLSFAVHFDSELPQYRTQGGVHAYQDSQLDCSDPLWTPGTVTSPVLMWIEALELVLDKMQQAQFPFHRVESIGGSAQQHGSVYWSDKGRQALERLQSLTTSPSSTTEDATIIVTTNSKKTLKEQFADAFTIYESPIWQDTSTGRQCKQLEDFMSAKACHSRHFSCDDHHPSSFPSASPPRSGGLMESKHGDDLLAELTGSRAFERFTASQILKIAQTAPHLLNQTVRISLVSSFLASLLVGHFAAIDVADGSGMNLLDLSTKTWDPYLTELIWSYTNSSSGIAAPLWREVVERCDSKEETDALGKKENNINRLTAMLGPIDTSGRTIQGVLAPWFVHKYGFRPTVKVTSFTGDNPATALAMQLQPGDAIVSLGTSDTVMLYNSCHHQLSDEDRHTRHGSSDSVVKKVAASERSMLLQSLNHNAATSILCHPIDPHGFLTLYCAKNGSLARERVRDEYASNDWELFDKLILTALERRRKSLVRIQQEKEETTRHLQPSSKASSESRKKDKMGRDDEQDEVQGGEEKAEETEEMMVNKEMVIRFGFYFFEREIWPPVKGVHRFEDGRRVAEFTGEATGSNGDGNDMIIRQSNLLAICESQLLAMKIRAMPKDNIKNFADTTPSTPSTTFKATATATRILATGGGSKSKALLQLMAHVFDVPVMSMSEDGWAGSAAWGAARKAFICTMQQEEDVLSAMQRQDATNTTASTQQQQQGVVYQPDPLHAAYYARVAKQFSDLEHRLEQQKSL